MLKRIGLIVIIGFIWGEAVGGPISGAVRGKLGISGSPYQVTGDLTVQPGDTLRIEPGVILEFDEDVSFVIYGRVLAVGTAEDSIVFRYGGRAAAGHWSGVYVNSAADTSQFSFLSVSGAIVGLSIDGAMTQVSASTFAGNLTGVDCKDGAAPLIANCYFEGNANAAVRANGASPRIMGCRFFLNSQSRVESVIVMNNGAGGEIVRNIIAFNSMSGIDCSGGSDPKIWHNTIVSNGYGLTVQSSSPEIVANVFYQNGSGIVMENGGGRIAYNDVFANGGRDFFGVPDGVGRAVQVNFRGDSCDAYFNLSREPFLTDVAHRNFAPKMASPLIDAGDPQNPAGIVYSGVAPDIGAIETNYTFPVELFAFRFEEGKLVWATATEKDNYGFAVWRSDQPDMAGAVRVGFVPGKGTSAVPTEYSFVDPNPAGDVQYYQLEQMDVSGASHWSDVVTAVYALPLSSDLVVEGVYPNPARGPVAVRFRLRRPLQVRVAVYDLLGRQVAVLEGRNSLDAGVHQLVWQESGDVPTGVYFLRLETPAGNKQLKVLVRH